MIMGPSKSSGVTTTTILFGQYLAMELKQKVLLIDANFNTPTLYRSFNTPESPGFCEYLDSQSEVCTYKTSNENLFVMPPGNKALLKNTLLALHDRNKSKLQALDEKYDVILMDSEPITNTPESFCLASIADGVIMVVRAEKVRKEVLSTAKDRLEQAGATIVGGIYNRRHFHIPSWLYSHLG